MDSIRHRLLQGKAVYNRVLHIVLFLSEKEREREREREQGGLENYLNCSSSMICSRAYDQAAIKFRGVEADINFTLDDYKEDIKKVIRLSQSRTDATQERTVLFTCIFLNFFFCHGICIGR